jgi:hypothetical protein
MGLESHIKRVLDEKSEYTSYDYWFEFGLKCENEAVAKEIARILNESGEFGTATAFWQGGLDCWGVKFDPLTAKEYWK